jgi:hypothetical protein
MQDRIFGDREKAIEEAYFRNEDARLLGKLRQKAHLDDIGQALAQALQVNNPDLLLRARSLGITLDTAAALFLAPLVQVAWAGGSVTKPEHDAVLRLARGRGVEIDSASYAQINDWLEKRPPDTLFETAVEVIKYGFSVLPPDEKEQRIRTLVAACHEVAEASGSTLGWVLGLKSVSDSEAVTLDTITNNLRRPESHL